MVISAASYHDIYDFTIMHYLTLHLILLPSPLFF